MLGAVSPIGPAEATGWGTGVGLAIHPAREVGRAAGVGWKGCKYMYMKLKDIHTPETAKLLMTSINLHHEHPMEENPLPLEQRSLKD